MALMALMANTAFRTAEGCLMTCCREWLEVFAFAFRIKLRYARYTIYGMRLSEAISSSFFGLS
jgi:hypothetical protein